jgi:hypothetical protein
MPRKQPSWLIRQISSTSSAGGAEALVGVLDDARPGRRVADVVVGVVRSGTQVVGQCLPGLLRDVGDDDLGALRDEVSRDGLALSLRATGDDGDLAVQASHVRPSAS